MHKWVGPACGLIVFALGLYFHAHHNQDHVPLESHHGSWTPQIRFPSGNDAAMWNWMEKNGVATEEDRRRNAIDYRYAVAQRIPDEQFMRDALAARVGELGPRSISPLTTNEAAVYALEEALGRYGLEPVTEQQKLPLPRHIPGARLP